jgi:hypothetical protein
MVEEWGKEEDRIQKTGDRMSQRTDDTGQKTA